MWVYQVWRSLEPWEQARYAAWGFSTQRLLDRNTFTRDVWGDSDDFIRQAVADKGYHKDAIQNAALVVAWYRRSPWSDAELVDQIKSRFKEYSFNLESPLRNLLINLGDAGRNVIADLKRKQAEEQAKLRNPKQLK